MPGLCHGNLVIGFRDMVPCTRVQLEPTEPGKLFCQKQPNSAKQKPILYTIHVVLSCVRGVVYMVPRSTHVQQATQLTEIEGRQATKNAQIRGLLGNMSIIGEVDR